MRTLIADVEAGVELDAALLSEARLSFPRWMETRGISVEATLAAGVPESLLTRLGLIAGKEPEDGSDSELDRSPIECSEEIHAASDPGDLPRAGDDVTTAAVHHPLHRDGASPLRDRILVALSTYPGGRLAEPSGLTNGVLRERMAYLGSPMNVSRMLAVLEDEGLLNRVIFGKRCPIIELTEDGSAAAQLALDRRLEAETRSRAQVDLPVAVAVPAVSGEVSTYVRASAASSPASRSYIPPLSERWASRHTTGERRSEAAATSPDVEGSGLSDEDVLWELDVNAEGAPVVDLSVRQRIRDLTEAVRREQDLTAELRNRLASMSEERTDLRLRVKSLEDDLAMYISRSAQLERNLDAVMKGPDRTIDRQIEDRKLRGIISSRPG